MQKLSIASSSDDKAMFRLPGDLRDRLKAIAKANGRSMNTEVVLRLRASIEEKTPVALTVASMIEEFVQAEVKARLQQIAAQIGGGA